MKAMTTFELEEMIAVLQVALVIDTYRLEKPFRLALWQPVVEETDFLE